MLVSDRQVGAGVGLETVWDGVFVDVFEVVSLSDR